MVAQLSGEPVQLRGFELAKPLWVMVWQDRQCVWVESREFEILEHGKTRKEALLRTFERFLSLALACRETLGHQDRGLVEMEPCEERICREAQEYIGETNA